ncbi:MAG: type II toxin-antitoxin system VapC family toxin [Longimicrobiaceae bacterium]
MDRPRVYIETTIPSAYFDKRTAPEMVARREATRRWWGTAGERFEMVTSSVVREELERGPLEAKAAWLTLINDVRVLEIESQIPEIVSAYLKFKLMPPGDAHHLAFASLYGCEYLLTWNFRHLANPNKSVHIQWMNQRLGLFVPRILAPSELLGGDYDGGSNG